METNTSRFDPQHLLALSHHFLSLRDFSASRKFALSAQALDPNLTGPLQILAIADVLLAAGRRLANNQLDYYSILQIRKSQFRFLPTRLNKVMVLLDPAKNKYPFSAEAYNLVSKAWRFLPDPEKKTQYDNEISGANDPQNIKENVQGSLAREQPKGFEYNDVDSNGNGSRKNNPKQERCGNEPGKLPSEGERDKHTFWTVCPYCYHMYEYEKIYEECCLLCQKCRRGFHGLAVPAPPASVLEGKEEVYHFGFWRFPLGYSGSDSLGDKKANRDVRKRKVEDVVVISDDSDGDDDERTNMKNEDSYVKEELSKGDEAGGMNMMQGSAEIGKGVNLCANKVMGTGRRCKETENSTVEEGSDEDNKGTNLKKEDSYVKEGLSNGRETENVSVMQGSEGTGKEVKRRVKAVGVYANKVMGTGKKRRKVENLTVEEEVVTALG